MKNKKIRIKGGIVLKVENKEGMFLQSCKEEAAALAVDMDCLVELTYGKDRFLFDPYGNSIQTKFGKY